MEKTVAWFDQKVNRLMPWVLKNNGEKPAEEEKPGSSKETVEKLKEPAEKNRWRCEEIDAEQDWYEFSEGRDFRVVNDGKPSVIVIIKHDGTCKLFVPRTATVAALSVRQVRDIDSFQSFFTNWMWKK
jgi:hypothetical protein